MSSYDYVIVGAGSSGSALAGRLATNNNTKILLLEAGPKDYNPYIKLPIGYGKLFYDQSVNWKFIRNQKKTFMERKCIGLEERFWADQLNKCNGLRSGK